MIPSNKKKSVNKIFKFSPLKTSKLKIRVFDEVYDYLFLYFAGCSVTSIELVKKI